MEAYKQTRLHPHSQPEDYVFSRNRPVSCQRSSSDGGELFSSSLAVSLLNNLATGTFIIYFFFFSVRSLQHNGLVALLLYCYHCKYFAIT